MFIYHFNRTQIHHDIAQTSSICPVVILVDMMIMERHTIKYCTRDTKCERFCLNGGKFTQRGFGLLLFNHVRCSMFDVLLPKIKIDPIIWILSAILRNLLSRKINMFCYRNIGAPTSGQPKYRKVHPKLFSIDTQKFEYWRILHGNFGFIGNSVFLIFLGLIFRLWDIYIFIINCFGIEFWIWYLTVSQHYTRL